MVYINEQCEKCIHKEVCANVMKNQLFIREKMLKEENPKCEQFLPTADVEEVTRCERCVYWKKYENSAGAGYCMCQEFAFEYGQMGYVFHPITIPKFHCGYGIERKTANEQEGNN